MKIADHDQIPSPLRARLEPVQLLSFHAERICSESTGMAISHRNVRTEPESARLAVCARLDCRRQFSVCGRCDRGRRYCGAECAEASRGESLRRAGRAYQRTERGRKLHAARQARYRVRRVPVTHHSEPGTRESLAIVPSAVSDEPPRRSEAAMHSAPRGVGVRAPGAAWACLACDQSHAWHRIGFRVHPLRRQRSSGAGLPSAAARRPRH